MMVPEKNGLSDSELVAHLASLCLDETRVKAEIVAYLVEVEDRRLHLLWPANRCSTSASIG